MVSVFGPRVFAFGAETDEDYDGCLPKDVRYWRVLMACQRNDECLVRELLQDLTADEHLREDRIASVFCDCFLIATRTNSPGMVAVLHEEAKDLDAVHTKLENRQDSLNCLAEAIRLGHYEVFELLLKWKWNFGRTRSDWTYTDYLFLILGDRLCLNESVDELEVRQRLMRIMLEWTDRWRNISKMKEFLVRIGQRDAQWALQVAVDTLRSQHYFRHERGEEGSFLACDPLADLAKSNNLELLRLYFDNQHLLLPHTTTSAHMDMRRLVIAMEFERTEGARVDVLKLVAEHSPDLLESRHDLQAILIEQVESKLETWAWLAKKVGLHALCEDEEQTLGSAMLALAVSKLNIETVRFLVNNGVQLSKEASTFQVYEDDDNTMKRLLIVRELLGKGGQGAVRERRAVETTFLPIKVMTHRRRLSDISIRVRSTSRAGSSNAAAKAANACPRFLRRSLGSASKATFVKKERPAALASGKASGSTTPPDEA